jgi:hypothetical protein
MTVEKTIKKQKRPADNGRFGASGRQCIGNVNDNVMKDNNKFK